MKQHASIPFPSMLLLPEQLLVWCEKKDALRPIPDCSADSPGPGMHLSEGDNAQCEVAGFAKNIIY